MPRGKKITVDEQIRAIEDQMETVKSKLEGLKAQRDELLKKKQEEELQDLMNLMKNSGKTVEDIREIIATAQ